MHRHSVTWRLSFAAGATAVPALWSATEAAAHAGVHPVAADPWWAWSSDPWTIVPITAAGVLYAVGVVRLWRNARRGAGIRRWQGAAFTVGWLVTVAALLSPVDALGEILFWVHMVQHELLILIAAPLLVLSAPRTAFLWAMPRRWRHGIGAAVRFRGCKMVWAAVTAPVTAWMLHAAFLWGWHAPMLFEASLRSDPVHIFQHVSFFGSALLFWAAVLDGHRTAWGYGFGALAVFGTAVHSSALGALLTFAPRVWYPTYAVTAPAWGVSGLEDQQLGGLIMWIPGGAVFLVAGLALVALGLRESERRAQRDQKAWMGSR